MVTGNEERREKGEGRREKGGFGFYSSLFLLHSFSA